MRTPAARSWPLFLFRRTALSWTSAYHPAVAGYRLGKVLQYDILTELLATGEADHFDFGAGRYPWKFEWAESFDASYRLRMAASSTTP